MTEFFADTESRLQLR